MKRRTIIEIAVTLLMLSTMFVNLLVTVQGYDYGTGDACVIHACDAGRGNVQPSWSYELNYVQWAANDIVNYAFSGASRYVWVQIPYYGGYYMYQGPTYGHLENYIQNYESSTTRSNVLDGITDCENHHPFTTFLYIGHMAYSDPNYGFKGHGKGKEIYDPTIDNIWDYDVSSRVTSPSNHHFVFLWVCRNAEDASNMRTAWTKSYLSGDAYNNPDSTTYCFIGFQGASPMMCKELNGANNLHKHWLVFFYYYAGYYYSYSINGALDKASQATGYADFAACRLYQPQGFSAWFPGFEDPNQEPKRGWYVGRMRVHGNGNIHIPGNIFEGGPLG